MMAQRRPDRFFGESTAPERLSLPAGTGPADAFSGVAGRRLQQEIDRRAAGGGGGNKPPADGPTPPDEPDAPGPGVSLPKNRMAAVKLINFVNSPMGEEVLEGVLGGTMVVAPQFFSEEDPRENALQLALAIGGGIGVGMAGRRIGASLGKRFHKDPIENEFASAIGGAMGQERMSQGLTNAMSQMSAMQTVGGIQTAGLRLRSDLASLSDDAFAATYPDLAKAGLVPSKVTPQQIESLSAFEQQLGKGVRENLQQQAEEMGGYAEKFKGYAADEAMPEDLRQLADNFGGLSEGMGNALLGKKDPVTGEHVGRAVGRFIGDEVGILGGAGIGALIAQGLGWQSSKDLEIARLSEELAQLR
jgi:hypothetical protein